MFKNIEAVKTNASSVPTLISNGTEILGDIHFDGELIVEGRVKGSIHALEDSSAVIRIADKGVVEGNIRVPSAVINGLVQGDVFCGKHIELASKAIVVGDLHYNLIEMVLGSEVNGKLMHINASKPEVERLEQDQSRLSVTQD
jgi:cytoskeletal protein CcmA (bactofilin family)